MNQRMEMDDVKRVLVEEARTDAIGLWAVLWEIKQKMPSLSPQDAQRTTLTIIREALEEHRVVVGQFVEQDEDNALFVPWPVSVEEAIARIDREWRALGSEPNLGEVAWFVDPHLLPIAVRRHPMGRGWRP